MIVRTLNSEYSFDLANKQVTRTTVVGFGMRRDGESMNYIDLSAPVVGQRMVMILLLRKDGIVTRRETSEVLEIR